MKIYVAFRTDVEPPTRLASPSATKLKAMMKSHKPGAKFTVALFDVKPNAANLCQLVMDVTEFKVEKGSVAHYAINKQGWLQEVVE